MSELVSGRRDATAAIGRSYELSCGEFTRIPQLAQEALPQLYGWLAGQGIEPAGPEVFEYRFLDGDGDEVRFRLTIAVPTAKAVTPPAPMEAVTLSEFRYVEIVTNSFRDEWPRVRSLAEAAGRERTGLEREVYHAWHGEGHPDTRVALQVGVR